MNLTDQVSSLEPSRRPSVPGLKAILGYWVSDDGRVFSEKYKRRVELKQSEHKGYRRVCFSHENKRQHYPVHRLVAQAFIPNPENKPFVNHKDGNKKNNIVSNLEWVTASENQRHAYGELGIRNGHTGYRYTKLYPNEGLRSRLVELGVPRWRHNLAELGEMLPGGLEGVNGRPGTTLHVGRKYPTQWFCGYALYGQWFNPPYLEWNGCEIADTEADARAKMLIYLLENGLITI